MAGLLLSGKAVLAQTSASMPSALSTQSTSTPTAAPTAAPGPKPTSTPLTRPLPTPVAPAPKATPAGDLRRCLRIDQDERAAPNAAGAELARLWHENVQARALLEDDKKGEGLDANARECLAGKERVLAKLLERFTPAEHALAPVQTDLGEYYLLMGRTAEAAQALEKASAAGAGDLRTQFLRARVAREVGNTSQELSSLRTAIQSPPPTLDDIAPWSEAFRSLKGRNPARDSLEALLRLRAKWPKSRALTIEEAELALELKDLPALDRAIGRLSGTGTSPRERAGAAYFAAQKALVEANDLKALDAFRTYLSRSAGSFTTEWDRIAFTELARIHLKTKNPLVAVAAAQEGLLAFPADAELTRLLEASLREINAAGRLPSANQIREALGRSPNSLILRRLWARALLKESRIEEAESQAKLVTDRDASDAEAWSLRGQASFLRKRFKPAQGFFAEALTRIGFREAKPRLPKDFPLAELVLAAARTEEARGYASEAREILRRGLELSEAKEDKDAIRNALQKSTRP